MREPLSRRNRRASPPAPLPTSRFNENIWLNWTARRPKDLNTQAPPAVPLNPQRRVEPRNGGSVGLVGSNQIIQPNRTAIFIFIHKMTNLLVQIKPLWETDGSNEPGGSDGPNNTGIFKYYVHLLNPPFWKIGGSIGSAYNILCKLNIEICPLRICGFYLRIRRAREKTGAFIILSIPMKHYGTKNSPLPEPWRDGGSVGPGGSNGPNNTGRFKYYGRLLNPPFWQVGGSNGPNGSTILVDFVYWRRPIHNLWILFTNKEGAWEIRHLKTRRIRAKRKFHARNSTKCRKRASKRGENFAVFAPAQCVDL